MNEALLRVEEAGPRLSRTQGDQSDSPMCHPEECFATQLDTSDLASRSEGEGVVRAESQRHLHPKVTKRSADRPLERSPPD